MIEKIVQLKRAARLEELQVARLLRKELECFALRWVLEPKKTFVDTHKKFPHIVIKKGTTFSSVQK